MGLARLRFRIISFLIMTMRMRGDPGQSGAKSMWKKQKMNRSK